MSISNTKILIKRSSTTSIPSGLQAGELAYSFASNTLFLGNTTGTGVVNIGGYLYTSTIDAATSSNTSNTLVKRGSDGSFAGQLYGTANLAVALANPQNFSISGGDITATAQSFQGNNSVTLNASLNSITGLTGGVYGSASYVPILGIAANGRVMNVTTQQIYTSFNINDGTNSNTLNGGATLFFKPGGGVTTTEATTGDLPVSGISVKFVDFSKNENTLSMNHEFSSSYLNSIFSLLLNLNFSYVKFKSSKFDVIF